jgi:hypothetical protein
MSGIQDSLSQILEKREVILGLKEVANARLAFCSEQEQRRSRL